MEPDTRTLKQVAKVLSDNTLLTADEYKNEQVIIEYIDNLIDLSVSQRDVANLHGNEYVPSDEAPFKSHRNKLIVGETISEADAYYEVAEIAEFLAYTMAKSIGYKPTAFENSKYREFERMEAPKYKGEQK